jgi:hypothetical protein
MATTALANRAGRELARRTGRLPLEEDLTLVDSGLMANVISATAQAALGSTTLRRRGL